MANITITALPTAGAITGAELVPVVQNGVTVQTTAAAISASPSQFQPFLTIGQQTTLPNSRAIGAGTGLSITDGGPQSALTLSVNGALLSLVNSGTGLQVKTGSTTVTNVQIAVGTGLTITSPDGLSGNPTIGLAPALQNIVSTVGTGLLAISGSVISATAITGTTNQITVTNGTTTPTIGIAANPVLPGTASATLPSGASALRPAVGVAGMIRYNLDMQDFEGYTNIGWQQFGVSNIGVTTFSAGTTGLTPSAISNGAITLGGVLNVLNGGTGNSSGTVISAGTVTAAAQPNITSVGTLTSLTLSGALTGTSISATTFTGALSGNASTATSATTATTATNISGGLSGSIPYQSAVNTTAFVSAGTNGYVLTLAGGLPTWAAFTSGVSSITGTANQITASASTGAVTLSLPATITGLTSVTSTGFTGTLTGHASLDLPLSGGSMTGGLGFFSVVSITAAGTTQGTATALTGDNNIVTTVASGTGVVIPAGTVGREISIVNRGANALLVYPASGAQIDSAGANLPTSVPPNAVLELECTSSTQWYAITPVYVAGAGISITQSNNGTVTFATSAIPNTSLANNSVTIGSTNIALGGTATTIAGLTSVISTGFTGALTGNASTSTTATNIAAGTANAIHYQTGSGATSFITVPTVASTYLEWNGSAFVWAAAGGGFTNPLTTTGDMIYSSSGTTPTRLGIGSTGQVLTVVAGIPAWSNDVYAPAAVTITGGTINGTSVGATTPSTGAFTTLTSTSDATMHGLTVGTGAGAIATNVAVGQSALAANTTATSNTAIGSNALKTVTTGYSNVAIGANAMSAAGVGSNQTVAIGTGALQSGTGSGTVAIGVLAAQNASGSNVTAIGYGAGGNLTSGGQNTVVGASAGAGSSGSYNSSFGYSALPQSSSAIAYNSVFGANSLTLSQAANNSAFGYNTLASNSSGANNVVIGYQAGYTATPANANTTGSNNTWVGYNTGPGTTTQLSNATALGNGALNTASNQIVLGNTSVTSTIINGSIGLSAPLDTTTATPTIASATTISPVNAVVFISGTAPITTITAPTTNINSAQITLIPTGIFTTTITGNIALASTAVVSKALVMTYSVNTAKWYPSY